MSKKKTRPAARKAAAKTVKKKVVTRVAARRSGMVRSAANGATTRRTSQITIFLFKTPAGTQIRTAPQLAFAGPGHIEWTVVNLIDGDMTVPVTISWPGGGPWGKDPIVIRDGVARVEVGSIEGRFKYVVSALDAEEDPEIEIPEV